MLSSASEKKRRCFGVPPLADPPLVDQLVQAVFPWCQAKMRPAFARAREPSRIVDGDLKAIDARAPAPEAVIRTRQTESTRTQRLYTLLLPTRNAVLRHRAHSTGRSCASGIEEQIADTVPKMLLSVCPR